MEILMIVAQWDAEECEILDSWDEYLLDTNPDGYARKLKEFREKHKGVDIREVVIEVPDDFYTKVFSTPPRVKGTMKVTE